MPIKLTSAQYRIIGIMLVVAAVSFAVALKYFGRAFPEASISFRVNKDESTPIAAKFLADRGFHVDGYLHAAIFDYNDDTKLYLERTQGLDRMQALARGPVHLWRWEHRWFRSQQKEEFRVDVTPAGDVVGFDHEIPEAAPGANLEQSAARAIAERFLTTVMNRSLGDLEFVEAVTTQRPARADHAFTWKQKSVNLGDGSLRIEVDVAGDQVSGYTEFVKIPDQWSRDYQRLRSRNDLAQIVDQVLWFFLSVALIAVLILRLRDRDLPLGLAAVFGFVGAGLFFLSQLNSFGQEKFFHYLTTDPYSSFLVKYVVTSLLEALAAGVGLFLLVAGSEPMYREGFPHLLSLRGALSWRGLRTRSFFIANVVGLGLTFVFFAYQTVFYLAANKLGAWAPTDVNFSNDLNTRLPWVAVLFGGFLPAVMEEMQFRAFAIPLLKKLVRYMPLAIVLAAFNWGFLHSAYPNQPFFIRGIEVGVGGIIIGFIMLRFGIVATMIWHYSVDALYTAFLLLRSPDRYLMASGAATAGIMLVPLAVALVAYWKTGTFADESELTNSSAGIRREPPGDAAAATGVAPLDYQPLGRRRLIGAAALVVMFIAVAAIPVYRFGEGFKVGVARAEAIRSATAFLEARHVSPADYHSVAQLGDHVDDLDLKYLLQYRSLDESDRIYRQATKLALWEVRYFRPLQQEEHLVFVDPEDGKVFAYRHVLDEDAPGASLTPDQARSLGSKFLEEQGYNLAGFDLQRSEAQKRKAREDYTLVWQAKAGDPRNVAAAYYRLEEDIAGNEVAGFVRSFKLPDEWVRRQEARGLGNTLLSVAQVLFLGLLLAGFIYLLVAQIRKEEVRWRPALKVGIAAALVFAVSGLNEIPVLYQGYNTSVPLTSFWIELAAVDAILVLGLGLFAWLLVALATSLYPDIRKISSGAARQRWRRDALIAVVVSLAAGAAMNKMDAYVARRFHAIAPVGGDIVQGLSAAWPGTAFFLHAVLYDGVLITASLAVVIRLVRLTQTHEAWWRELAVLLLVLFLGPPNAHSVPEFALAWGLSLVHLAIAAGIIVLFFRDNVLAYVAATFCLGVAQPLVELFSQPAPFFRTNGVVLAVLAAVVLAWLFLPVSRSGAGAAAPS
ncbi:MAG TPA: CPBP family intramembrane glutamic endopeptidase [Terriglobia bacterium]|nr:CPBP family intramembrane glutamic endopeptidase [Terriglobia bacterium]